MPYPGATSEPGTHIVAPHRLPSRSPSPSMCPTKMRLMDDRTPPPELTRERGAFVLRDEVAGYCRYLEPWELARLVGQGADLIRLHVMCEGKIPGRG